MDFVGAIQSVFKNFANFRGVAGRAEYWYFVLFVFLVSLVVAVVDSVVGFGIIGVAFNLVILIPSLSVLVRRLRDAGFSWAWLLAPILSVIVLFVGIFGIVNLGIQSGLLNWEQLMDPDSELTAAAITSLANDPNFYGYGIMTFVGLLFAGIFSLIVNVIFPLMASKSAAEGNKRIKPETL
ncbi:MAG: hypothetical protein RL523_441 [Actinomycetota bacterium]|jgi:uncharacterized membrane protein YhaH (DUF805 family)